MSLLFVLRSPEFYFRIETEDSGCHYGIWPDEGKVFRLFSYEVR